MFANCFYGLIRTGQQPRDDSDHFLRVSSSPAAAVPPVRHDQRRVSVCLCCAGSSGSLRSQPDENSQQLTVPTDLFRPISPHSHSDSESIPRLPAPRRAHTFSRTLRRQVTKRRCSEIALSVFSPAASCQRPVVFIQTQHYSGSF